MRLKSIVERPLYYLPRLHAAALIRRPTPDLNKIAWVVVLKRGQTVLDVGANRGQYTEFFSRKVGRRGSVYAFEPVPESAQALRRRCGSLGNVRIVQAALTDQVGNGQIYVPGGDFQQASLAKQAAGSWTGGTVSVRNVEFTTLDSWAAGQTLQRIDLVKLDVEGAEHRVLRGGQATLARFRPLIYMEICSDWLQGFGIVLSDLARDLADLGYRYAFQPTIENERFLLRRVDLREATNGDYLVSPAPLECGA